ncbi:MAG: hypothetical protein UT86_C0003G0004 [Candidatus Magasanikbacteria bacterium GW2011_GWC2_40_17]|uniref:Nucleoid-associated protein n=1 Tax=Candidatus Magasanikbacteria bacterium GW2011_GWA2_42_32 TaxID=1619039 RepID=A0A0G1A780_9BACT|nr:MAG: hypothetical protein UT86_C0003G0004 [Candidatus Magasanikbacteria bacterium GW2011_GWC2_40_17]KKS56907.1 MAG: hypothetical protein UV20_C0004G0003 [Candidatus Magasanikbacteria bacterium GW2011_GWA2_42_32]OGH85523.1 MAG: hypothetical protein A2294_03260 [Candidatus Magasanikbacteria bacterium RIFOXYB2_FULL_38_10]
MFEKLKQFKDLREKAKDIQSKLAEEKVLATAAWGKIKMEMNGNQEVLSVSVDEELLASKSKIEDAIKEVTNEAIKKAQKVMADKMMKDGGFKMPGM